MTIVKKTCLGNNLLAHVRENTYFLWQKSLHFAIAKFEG